MEISKDQVLQMLQERGQTDQAAQAEQELPQQVDTEQHSDLLSKFGIDPQELIGKFGGGLLG
jgi:DNA-binding protein H-NS